MLSQCARAHVFMPFVLLTCLNLQFKTLRYVSPPAYPSSIHAFWHSQWSCRAVSPTQLKHKVASQDSCTQTGQLSSLYCKAELLRLAASGCVYQTLRRWACRGTCVRCWNSGTKESAMLTFRPWPRLTFWALSSKTIAVQCSTRQNVNNTDDVFRFVFWSLPFFSQQGITQ